MAATRAARELKPAAGLLRNYVRFGYKTFLNAVIRFVRTRQLLLETRTLHHSEQRYIEIP
jgi:hypothetical protein